VAAVDAVKQSKTDPTTCTPPVKLNMFPSNAYPGTGNVAEILQTPSAQFAFDRNRAHLLH
jgi:hypothetical protein